MPKFKPAPLKGKFPAAPAKDALFGTSADLPHVIEVPLARLTPNPDQPRKTFSETSLRELADSIDSKGLLQPVVVKRNGEDGYFIVAGERRVRAFAILGRESIPAIATEGNADELAIIENLQREDLHPLEEAEALARLKERHGYNQGELAKIVGKARITVNELLSLNRLPEEIKEECRTSDTFSKSALIELARLDSTQKQRALFSAMKQGPRTVAGVREAKAASSDGSKSQTSPAKRVVSRGQAFLKALSELPSRGVSADVYGELADLRRQINAAIQTLGAKRKR